MHHAKSRISNWAWWTVSLGKTEAGGRLGYTESSGQPTHTEARSQKTKYCTSLKMNGAGRPSYGSYPRWPGTW